MSPKNPEYDTSTIKKKLCDINLVLGCIGVTVMSLLIELYISERHNNIVVFHNVKRKKLSSTAKQQLVKTK